ncbi:MAG: ATP-binding protein [Candidatus Margulisbacteria bacterium]|nr:ATP-binding protein [Candidatus Margulisiibacteriota bacterium]
MDPQILLQALNHHLNTNIDVNHDLIIFDEIQEVPAALTSLKYFYEEMPELTICAAGSLLGIFLAQEGSYPVGKVELMSLYPMCFEEFLLASGQDQLVDSIHQLWEGSTIHDIVHDQIWSQLKHYFIVGGLPESVAVFIENKQESLGVAFQKVRNKQNDLIVAYESDIAKHSGKLNSMTISRLLRNIPAQLASDLDHSKSKKFTFSNVSKEVSGYQRLSSSIDWLETAGLIYRMPIVNSGQLPFSHYSKENVFKLFIFDVGILGALSDLSPVTIQNYDYGTYKGYFAENFVLQEFIFSGLNRVFAWREKSAEIEFLREKEGHVIPVEVKAGFVTQAKSLKVFLNKYKPEYCIILSAKPFQISTKFHYYPLYYARYCILPESN